MRHWKHFITVIMIQTALLGMFYFAELSYARESFFDAYGREMGNIVLRGNKNYGSGVILKVARINPNIKPTKAIADQVRRRIMRFYRKNSYQLVRVGTKIQNGKLYILIDEGVLEKIIFIGKGMGTTALFTQMLNLPHKVFNKKKLESELDRLQKQIGIGKTTYKLVKIEPKEKKKAGFQLSDVGLSMIFDDAPAAYELHISVVPGKTKRSGGGFGARVHAAYGLILGAHYTHWRVFFDNEDEDKIDGAHIYLENGYNLRSNADGDTKLAFTHVKAGLRYDFPQVWKALTIFSDNYTDMSGAGRPDLPLNDYWFYELHASLNFKFDIIDELFFQLGGGVQYKSVFSIAQDENNPFFMVERMKSFNIPQSVTTGGKVIADKNKTKEIKMMVETQSHPRPIGHMRYFGEALVGYDFTPKEMRVDMHHTLEGGYSYYWIDISDFHRFHVEYKNPMPFGYNEFILRVKGLFTIGDTPFYDEVGIAGDYLRTFFNGQYFVDNVGWITLEYRQSLWRDIVKLSIFHDLALFGQLKHDPQADAYTAPEHQKFGWANSFGPGFHALFFDVFQLRLYYGFGFANSEYSHNLYFRFYKAF